ncbi:type I restriction enzyme HsdR N-terminal domain-containing protein [Dysgonomonas sp. OttesenSCG-928-M03]|nr:type I restriction enzyme HsdR N-terminal domain-containing protein [Dysgonomonas sp. OttesenSCG-928-M03]
MLALNLPEFNPKIKKTDKICIWDRIRRKYVALTPEEWVRQHFVNYLITEKYYPESLIANEIQIVLNNQKKRCDTVVYDRALTPLVIVEYKSPDVKITQDVFDQIVRYNMVLKVKYLIVSNGLLHYCCRINYEDLSYEYLPEIPDYTSLSK